MDILILGGTGAMGTPLVQILSKSDNKVWVTSRTTRQSHDNVEYITGDAHDNDFLDKILAHSYDVIIDFMSYETYELKRRIEGLLNKTCQYFFFSSSRVYAQTEDIITEDSNRILDICKDEEYISTDEYALAKARQEDVLINSGYRNWTIIRPYITYNDYRIQMGVYEKENWLYRALKGRTVVFPKEIADKYTTLTYGDDVAKCIYKLIGNEKAIGQIYNVMSDRYCKWSDIIELYKKAFYNVTGKELKVVFKNNVIELEKVWNKWQIIYDRLYNRRFSNKKLIETCDNIRFTEWETELENCIANFIKHPKWRGFDWRYEAWSDRVTGELTPLNEIEGRRNKLRYIKWRFLKK